MKKIAVITISFGICLVIIGAIININKSRDNQKTETNSIENNQIENTVIVNKKEIAETQFNDFVKNKFSSKYFTVTKLDANNNFANSDVKVTYNLKGKQGNFYLKSLWFKNYRDNKIQIADEIKTQSIKKYQQTAEEPVFIIIGIGGSPNSPKFIFAVPAEIIVDNEIEISTIDKYKKEKVEANFYYDFENKILK